MEVDTHVCRLLLFLLLLHCADSNNHFERVEFCPKSGEEWENRAQKKKCQNPTPDFMCAAIEDQPGKFGEICTLMGLSSAGKCAILDADTYNLNYVRCHAPKGCPNAAYRASDVYKYKACYEIVNSESTTTLIMSTPEQDKENTTYHSIMYQAAGPQYVLAITTISVFIIVFVIVALIVWMKKRSSIRKPSSKVIIDSAEDPESPLCQDELLDDQATQRITILANYLQSRLVVLCEDTLRNKLIMHSASLKEHFPETVDDIMHFSAADVKKMTLNTVYILLTNFSDIARPCSGWGYTPDSEDFSIGAEIERIRILLNYYLDNRHCPFTESESVLTRLRNAYGDVDDHMDIDFAKESKINYFIVKPNCVQENGIVVTQTIKEIFKKLETKGIAICCGAIGCGKTTSMYHVTEKYRRDGWKIKWMIESIENDMPLSEEKTILCCDNLFGTFGCEAFSKDVYKNFDNFLDSILKDDSRVCKVLLGIHTHVLDEIKSNVDCKYLQNSSISVDMDALSDSEVLLIYQLQRQKNIVKSSEREDTATKRREITSYETVLQSLASGSSIVGKPFQTLMFATLPEIFLKQSFCKNSLLFLTEHFRKLDRTDHDLFLSLFYIMRVMLYKKKGEIRLKESSAISPTLDKNTVDSYLKQLAPYLHQDEHTAEIKHEMFSIALFHAYFCTAQTWSVFKACDIGMTLQLVRLANADVRIHNFAVELPTESSESLRSIHEKLTDRAQNSGNPLLKAIVPMKVKR